MQNSVSGMELTPHNNIDWVTTGQKAAPLKCFGNSGGQQTEYKSHWALGYKSSM